MSNQANFLDRQKSFISAFNGQTNEIDGEDLRLFSISGAGVEIDMTTPDGDYVKLETIRAHEPFKGHGDAALEMLKAIAREVQIPIYAEPFPLGGSGIECPDELREWYKKRGFNDEFVYDPAEDYAP